MQETSPLATRALDSPLVSAQEAKNSWKEYQDLEEAILVEDDYMWFCEFQEWDRGQPPRLRVRKYTFNTQAQAQAECANHGGAIVKKRKIKSATRKMGKFFGLEMPVEEEIGTGEVVIRQEADFIIQIERSKYYTLTVWMDQELATVKASCTLVVRSPSGRTWIGHGGSHRKEGREDFTISETAFTRALNRAILDFVGFGEESAEETATSEPVPGEAPPQRPAQPAQPAGRQASRPAGQPAGQANGQAAAKPPTAAQQRLTAKRQEIVTAATGKGLTQDFMKATIANTFKKERLADLTGPQLDRMVKIVEEAKPAEPAQDTAPERAESPVAPTAAETAQSTAPTGAASESQPASQDAANPAEAGVVDGTATVVDGGGAPTQHGNKVVQWAHAHSLTDGETEVILGKPIVRYFEDGHSDLDAITTLDQWCREHRVEYPCGDVDCICTQQVYDDPPVQEADPNDPDSDDLPY